jgi:hypothetical protein
VSILKVCQHILDGPQQHYHVEEGDFTHPYFLAFQHNIEAMAKQMEDGGFPHDEPIAFVFDQQKEMEGRVKLLYDAVK